MSTVQDWKQGFCNFSFSQWNNVNPYLLMTIWGFLLFFLAKWATFYHTEIMMTFYTPLPRFLVSAIHTKWKICDIFSKIINYRRNLFYNYFGYNSGHLLLQPKSVAQSAGAVEYTDCTSAEGVRPPLTSVLDMTLNNLMVRFQQCWSFGNVEYPFIAIAPRSTLARSGSTW